MKKVLIVRLDAIGDYILWRNCLRFIRNSGKYRDAHLTVLGNPAWRSLAEAFDADCADEWIWAENRADLFRKSIENLFPYCVWHRRVMQAQKRLRLELIARRFDEVISPTAFPDPLLDEFVQGLAPTVIGVSNGNPSRLSAYTRLLDAGTEPFVFSKNRRITEAFAEEACKVSFELNLSEQRRAENEIVFFCGASHWTKRWPCKRWLALEQILRRRMGVKICYEGCVNSPRRPLNEFAARISSACVIVSNDTMALHLAAALNVPAVGIVNGVAGHDSFWPYPRSLGKRVEICAPSRIKPIPLPLIGSRLSQYLALSSVCEEDVASAVEKVFDHGNCF